MVRNIATFDIKLHIYMIVFVARAGVQLRYVRKS
jgi:hypothetical protein